MSDFLSGLDMAEWGWPWEFDGICPGTWLQIYLVFVTIAGIPFMLLRFLTTPILLSFHLHHDVAVTAGVYTIWSQAGFLFDVWYNSIKEYYAAQQITMPAAVVDAIFVVVNFLLTYVAVFPLKGGIIGAALAFCTAKLLRSLESKWARYGYGSIPISTIFRVMNIHKSQLFWGELQGYYWFWPIPIWRCFKYGLDSPLAVHFFLQSRAV